MTTLFLVSFFTLTAYVIGSSIAVGIPSSLSDTFYQLPSPFKHLFSVALFTDSVTLCPVMVQGVSEDFNFLAFLSCAALMVVAAAPQFKGIDKHFHQIAALVCAAIALIWCFAAIGVTALGVIIGASVIVNAIAWLIVGYDGFADCLTWRLEMSAFAATYACAALTL